MANVSMGMTARELFACNPFRVLGVAVNSHSNQIEDAYKRLSSLAVSGQQASYVTPFDFDSLPKLSRTAADVNTAYGKLSSNGYRCFAFSDPQFTVALNIDDVALNLQDITCYDCFLRCYMWLVINDSAFEWPEMWIPLAKYIDKLIASTADQWPTLFDNRFPEEMIGQGGQAYASFHQTFCEIILLPIKEMVRGSMRCKTATEILKVAKVDFDAPMQVIDIPQANKPLPGMPAPKLKLAVKEGEDVSAHEAENNDFGQTQASVISAVDISAPAAAKPEPAAPAQQAAPTVIPVPTPVRPVTSAPVTPPPAAPTRPAPVAPAPSTPVTPVRPAPVAPAPSTPVTPVRPAPVAPAPAAPAAQQTPLTRPQTSLTQTATPLTKPASSLLTPDLSAAPAQPAAPAQQAAPVQPAAPAEPPKPVPHFAPIQKLDNSGVQQSVSLGGTTTARAQSGLQTSTLMSAEDIAEQQEEQNMYTDTLIQLLRANRSTGMKAVDTSRAFNNGDVDQLGDGFDRTQFGMDELKLNSKLYDESRLAGENQTPKTFEQKYKNLKIDDMLNPQISGATKVASIDPMTQYVYNQKNTKKVGNVLIKFSLVVGVVVALVIALTIAGIL